MRKLADWISCVAIVACASGCIPIGIRGNTMAAADTGRSVEAMEAARCESTPAADEALFAAEAERPEDV